MSDVALRLQTRRVYTGRVIHVDVETIQLPNRSRLDLEMIRHPGASAVVPFLQDGRVVLIRQYRFAAEGYLFEVPAGKLDAGEAPEACARRETEEEAGYAPSELHALGFIYTSPGFTDERIHLFAATGLVPVPQRLEEDEVIQVVPMPLDQALSMIRDGQIVDGKTICALLRADGEIRAGRLLRGG